MPALPFDVTEIEELVLRLNAVTAKEGADVTDLGGNATDDAVAESLQEVKGDLSRDEITQAIESMNDEQKDALVALFWIGRGDSGPEEWEETIALARQQHEGLVSRYLLGQPDAGEFLTEGLEKMLAFGVD
jgi:GTPase